VIGVADYLNFSRMFARRMTIISLLVGLLITFTMPITYFLMSWRDFNASAAVHGAELAAKTQQMVRDNPALWHYNVTRFGYLADELVLRPTITSIKIFDQNSSLRYEQVITRNALWTFPFHVPILYNNEVHGFIEFYESAVDIIADTLMLTFFFGLLGIVTGLLLYRYPVNIIRLVEQGVQSQAEQAKRQAASDVARLDRLRLVGEMAASIGHEVRNPLTTVKGYLQLFSRRTEFLSSTNQFQLMIDELDRANGIISEFLSLAHNKVVEMKNTNLNAVIRALQPLIQSDALIRGILVDIRLKDLPDTLLDENEVRQLILNITRNGLEAMTSGGCLTITTDLDAQGVILSIADQGKGIDPSLMPKLGTPFFTTKETGTGLGLAVCYSIAHRHKAEIDFVTGSGGTTFIIRFPLPQ